MHLELAPPDSCYHYEALLLHFRRAATFPSTNYMELVYTRFSSSQSVAAIALIGQTVGQRVG